MSDPDPSSFVELKQWLEKRIGASALANIQTFAKDRNPRLWGEYKADPFLENNVMLVIFKHASGKGFDSTIRQVNAAKRFSKKSLIHNTKLILAILEEWGKRQVTLGDLSAWRVAMRGVAPPPSMKTGCLWIDSTDFPVKKIRGEGTKSDYYSYKLNKHGRRFTMVRDGKGVIVRAWGGYSTKVHDSNLLEVLKTYVEEEFKGAVFFADCHYSAANKVLNGVKFLTPFQKPRNKRALNDDGQGIRVLSREKKAWNDDMSHIRARIEKNFAWMRNTMKCLQSPFQGPHLQLDQVVWFAIGLNNFNRVYEVDVFDVANA